MVPYCDEPVQSSGHVDLAGRRHLRGRADGCRGGGRLPDGLHTLRAQREHDLADRFRHLQPDRGHLSRRALRAADQGPRECGRAADLYGRAWALLAGADFDRDLAGVLPVDDGAHFSVLARVLRK